jgi:two-component system CheB/CheR fusion protein
MEGDEVEVAHDGSDGLDRAREFGPDVVLCDVGLPQMDGYLVAKAFRADPGLREAFLVALTGYGLPEDERRATDAGFDTHLIKPAAIEQIQEVIGRAPQRGATPSAARR